MWPWQSKAYKLALHPAAKAHPQRTLYLFPDINRKEFKNSKKGSGVLSSSMLHILLISLLVGGEAGKTLAN